MVSALTLEGEATHPVVTSSPFDEERHAVLTLHPRIKKKALKMAQRYVADGHLVFFQKNQNASSYKWTRVHILLSTPFITKKRIHTHIFIIWRDKGGRTQVCKNEKRAVGNEFPRATAWNYENQHGQPSLKPQFLHPPFETVGRLTNDAASV